MAKGAILNFVTMVITPDWNGYRYLHQILWQDAPRPRGDDHVNKSRNRKLIRVTWANESLKHKCFWNVGNIGAPYHVSKQHLNRSVNKILPRLSPYVFFEYSGAKKTLVTKNYWRAKMSYFVQHVAPYHVSELHLNSSNIARNFGGLLLG